MKGYFGIGVEGVSKAMNVGTLFRIMIWLCDWPVSDGMPTPTAPQTHAAEGSLLPDVSALLSRPILMAFLFFTLISLALGGVQTYMPTLLPQVQGVSRLQQHGR